MADERGGPAKRSRGDGTDAPSKKARLADIIDVAADLFLEFGYEQTKMQAIADRIGVLPGSLYYYIDHKEDILYWIIRSAHQDINILLEQAMEVDGPALVRFEHLAALHMRFTLENVARSAAFYMRFGVLSEERQIEITELRRTYEFGVVNLIETGQKEGDVCPDVSPAMSARALLQMFNSVHRWFRPETSRQSADELVDEYVGLAVAAIRCDPASHAPGHRFVAHRSGT